MLFRSHTETVFDDTLSFKRQRLLLQPKEGEDETILFSPPAPTSATTQFDSSTTGTKHLDLNVCFKYILLSDLTMENKNYTASKLTEILKKLSITVGNQKLKRLESLKDYFGARNRELEQHVNDQEDKRGIVGIEIIEKEDHDANVIKMIIRGGKKITRRRRCVCEAKYDEIEPIEKLSETEAKSICEKLYQKSVVEANRESFIDMLDNYITGLPYDPLKCQFSLVHGFV